MNDKFSITNIRRVIMVGKTDYQDQITDFTCDRLTHNELIFHLSGESKVYFNGIELYTAPNTIRFLPSGPNFQYTVHRITRGECIDVFFDTDVPIYDKAFVMDMSERENIAPLFKKVFYAWITKGEGYYLDCVSLIYKILAEMQKSTYVPSEHYQKIHPAVELIKNDCLKRNITIDELISITGISETYLNRLFVKRFGMSPKRYIIQIKLNYAAELLCMGGYSVSEVASLCGYSDVYFFSKQFKKHMGISPTTFIKEHMKSN